MKKEEGLEIGEIVQINPRKPMFGGCFMVVTEVRAFGAQGYVQVLPSSDGQAYLRPVWEDMEKTGGFAFWVVGSEEVKEPPP